MIRSTPSAFRTLKSAPAPKTPKGVQYEARYQLGGYNEREGARHAGLSGGDGDGAHYHGPEHARGQRVTYRAARKLRFRHHERDQERENAGRKARDRDQDQRVPAPLGRPSQARLDRHAHARQYREDESVDLIGSP